MDTSTASSSLWDEENRRWSAWMARANAGDAKAYSALLSELAGVAESYLRARFGDSDFLEDCVQESMLAVHRARASYDPRRTFRPWLFTIVRHKAIDFLRRRGTRSHEVSDSELVDRASAPAGSDPGRSLDGAKILAQLGPKYREALVLTKYAGYTTAEAAERTGVSRTAMKARVSRALRAVQRILESEGEPT